MLAKVRTATVVALCAVPVTVEVDVAEGGLPGLTLVGLPDAAVRESKERLKSAIRNSQFYWPRTRVTVNLAPAGVRKEGSAFDLPIALGLLSASNQLEPERFSDVVALGELALDGSLRPVQGVLPVALGLRGRGLRLLVPAENGPEAAIVSDVPVYPLKHLWQTVSFLKGTEPVAPLQMDPAALLASPQADGPDFSEVKGQAIARRAIEIAAAGGHNLLLIGPPGAGKTMLAERIPTVIPQLCLEEALESTLVYSVAGLLSPAQPLVNRRPFRAPHHTISDVGLIGGGTVPKPGELSLAHHGVLFLDELPEFNRAALEALRQPLEAGWVTVARVQGTATFPAKVMLVASMNPCPCGFSGDLRKQCLCTPAQIRKYCAKVSGPLLDRIDLHLEVPALSTAELTGDAQGEPSQVIRARVAEAHARQRSRFEKEPQLFCNARMRHRHLRRWCRLSPEGKEFLRQAIHRLRFSARAYDKILKVSRTIADLAGASQIQPAHLAEAVQYRLLDRSAWI